MPKKNDLTGRRVGRLTIIRATDQRGPDGGVVYECLCDCGNTCFVLKAPSKWRPAMSNLSLALIIIGTATVTNWLFKIIDAIEAPAKRRNRV